MNRVSIAILGFVALAGCGADRASDAPPPPRTTPYALVEEWTIPNGGYGRVVTVDSSMATESGLRALGDELKFDTRVDRNAFIFVYSDRRAATMRRAVLDDRLSKNDLKFYDDHFVGMYSRNINTAYHTLVILPNGLNGPQIEVKY